MSEESGTETIQVEPNRDDSTIIHPVSKMYSNELKWITNFQSISVYWEDKGQNR